MLITLYKVGEVHFCFHVKAKNERFTAAAHVVFRATTMKISRRRLTDFVEKLLQKCAAHAALLFFLLEPIKSLICCRCRRHLFREVKKCRDDGTKMTTPQINYLIGLTSKIIVQHVRHALWCNFLTTRAKQSESAVRLFCTT